MQTIIVDGTTYKVKFDRDPIELAKLARKPYKPKKPKDTRKFPLWVVTAADVVPALVKPPPIKLKNPAEVLEAPATTALV